MRSELEHLSESEQVERYRGVRKTLMGTKPQVKEQEPEPALKPESSDLDEIKKRIAEQDERLEEICAEIESMQVVGSMSGRRIACAVAKAHGITFRQLISQRRDREIVHARQHAMWEMRKNTPLSYPAIGRVLGGLEHTTVLHGVRRHQERLDRLSNATGGA